VIQAPPASIRSALAPQLADFIARLRAVRVPAGSRFGVSSWWRSIAHNREVGGGARSQHLLGLAIDTTPSAGSRLALRQAFERAGLVAIEEGDHIHVQRFTAGKIPPAVFTRLAR